MAHEAQRLTDECLLDGEAVGDILHVFDVLESAGVDFRSRPYADRLDVLQGLIPMAFTAIQPVYTAMASRDKIPLLERLRRENKEGVVLKNLTASYSPGKRQDRTISSSTSSWKARASWSRWSIPPNAASLWGCMPGVRSLTRAT